RADLRAGRREVNGSRSLDVGDRLPRALALDLGFLDALHAIRAFLHHAAHANGDVRVVTHALHFGQLVVIAAARVIVEEVEAPDLVGAVVRAVARADAAVVGHVIEAFGRV